MTDKFLFLTNYMFFKQIPTYIYIVVIAFMIMAFGIYLSKALPQAKMFFVSRTIEDIDDIVEMAESQNESPPVYRYQQQLHQHNKPQQPQHPLWTLPNQQQGWPQTQTQMPYVKTSKFRKRLTPRQKEDVLQRYGYRCGTCRKILESFDTEFDHIIALATDRTSRFSDQLNHILSFQPLCRRCHGWKCHVERKQGIYRRSP